MSASEQQTTVLVMAPDAALRKIVLDVLLDQGLWVVAVESAMRASEELTRSEYDVVVAQVHPKVQGADWLQLLRDHKAGQEIVLLSEPGVVAAALLRGGPTEVVGLPVENDELVAAVWRCAHRVMMRRGNWPLEEAPLSGVSALLHQRCIQLISNPDLVWLQERLLAELCSTSNAQSAAMWFGGDRDELILRAYRGLLDKQVLPDRLDARGEVAQHARQGQPWVGTGMRGEVAQWVPLVAQGELVGLVQLSDPLSGTFEARLGHELSVLADFAAAAVRTGRRLIALQRLGLKDKDSGAYNLSYFTDYASKEIYKARRYGRSFSLLTFSLDHLAQIRMRLGPDEARRAARGVIRALTQLVRDSDVVAKASEQEFYLMLPETDAFGALMFLRRALNAAREDEDVRDIESRLTVGLVGASATYPRDGEDFDELIHRCRRRMSERRDSLSHALALESLSFWEQVELLLGGPQSPKLPTAPNAEPSGRGKVAESLFQELQVEVSRELLRDPSSRGLVYLGTGTIRADLPAALAMEAAPPDLAARMYVLGKRSNLESHPALTPVFLDSDERLSRMEFLLWLGETSSYALLQRPGRGATWGFHTSDSAVVEGLITQLQLEYDLQPY
jgi:two-component system cell cycle response regulator